MNDEERRLKQRQYYLGKIKDNSNFYHIASHSRRLEQFKVTRDNEQAFKMAMNYIPLMDDFKDPYEHFTNEQERDNWYENMRESPHFFLTFVGPPGRGKTHLALGIGIAMIEKNEVQTVYYQVPELLNYLRSASRPGSDVDPYEILNRCCVADCLILDDLGMQKNTDWAMEQLDSIIDHRYLNQSQTIFTSNLLPQDLGSARIASRIKEGEIAILGGPDYREIIVKQRKEQRELKNLNEEFKEISTKKERK